MIQIYPLSINTIVDRIKNKNHFAFAKYGDGEWFAMSSPLQAGRNAVNCDGNTSDVQCGRLLLNTVVNPIIDKNYLYGFSAESCIGSVPRIVNSLKSSSTIKWYDGDWLVKACKQAILYPFIKEIQKHNLCIVAPNYSKKTIEQNLSHNAYIISPDIDSYKNKEILIESIYSFLDEKSSIGQYSIILLSLGWSSEILIHQLFSEIDPLSYPCCIIDIGGLWDTLFQLCPPQKPNKSHLARSWHLDITDDMRYKMLHGPTK